MKKIWVKPPHQTNTVESYSAVNWMSQKNFECTGRFIPMEQNVMNYKSFWDGVHYGRTRWPILPLKADPTFQVICGYNGRVLLKEESVNAFAGSGVDKWMERKRDPAPPSDHAVGKHDNFEQGSEGNIIFLYRPKRRQFGYVDDGNRFRLQPEKLLYREQSNMSRRILKMFRCMAE